MSIVFLILKIVVLILISLIALILLILALVLFVPIKYQVELYYDENISVFIKLSWLFNLLSFKYASTEEEKDIETKFMFFKLGKKDDKKEEEPKKAIEEETTIEKDENKEYKTKKDENYLEENTKTTIEKNNDKESVETNNKKETKKEKVSKDQDKTKDEDKNESLLDKIKNIKAKILYIYNYPDRKEIIELSKELLVKLYRRIKPKKFLLEVEFGFSDNPEYTGQILGLFSILNTQINPPYDIFIKGNFNEDIIRVGLNTNGSVSLGLVLIPFGKYIISKPIWKLVKKYIWK